MGHDRIATLFFEMFDGLPRQGPGDTACTLKALALVPGVGPDTRILDLGCGTGAQTRALALNSAARIVAVDNHGPFVAELKKQALALADRLDARVGDMRRLDFVTTPFDVIWCEGAIYNVGFEAGLRDWRRVLVPGGHVAVTEACWMRNDPPAECAAFWNEEYPAIRGVSERLATVERCGYETVGHFPLPPSSWWDDYYRPLQENITRLRQDHAGEAEAQHLADQFQREIDIWHRYSAYYGYEFFVMRAG
jgi:SAM-dependent methyltransferase